MKKQQTPRSVQHMQQQVKKTRGWHRGDLRIFKQLHQISFGSFLQSFQRNCLPSGSIFFGTFVIESFRDLFHHTSKRQFTQQEICPFLKLSNLVQCFGPRTISFVTGGGFFFIWFVSVFVSVFGGGGGRRGGGGGGGGRGGRRRRWPPTHGLAVSLGDFLCPRHSNKVRCLARCCSNCAAVTN